jgi:hypothetical protein
LKDWVPDKDILGSALRCEKLGDFGVRIFFLPRGTLRKENQKLKIKEQNYEAKIKNVFSTAIMP